MYLVCTLATALLLSSPQAAPPPQDAQTPNESTQNAPAEQKPAATQNPPTPAKKKAPATAHKRKLHKHLPPPIAGPPHKIVIRQGSTPEPTVQLVPGMSQAQASHQRQNTEQLLASTETNLQQIAGRSLNATQQETVGQIRNYIVGAHSALKDGDTQRAHRLASKAQQLADDLVKHYARFSPTSSAAPRSHRPAIFGTGPEAAPEF